MKLTLGDTTKQSKTCEDGGTDPYFEEEELVLTQRLFPNVSELQVAATASPRRQSASTPSMRPHESLRVA